MAESYKCENCNKNFKTSEALDMHKSSKHFDELNKSGKFNSKKFRNWAIFIIIVGLAIWGIYAMIESQDKYDSFAQCLTEEGVTMYGAYWCPACQEQKRIFASSWEYITYIECSLPNRGGQNELCNNEGIQSYPTWEFEDGSRMTGVLSINQLKDKTGCLVESS